MRATTHLTDVATCDALLLVAPAQHVRSVSKALRPSLRKGQPVVICAKGIEQSSGQMMGDILAAELPHAMRAALSGPSFAADVARGLPTALTIACTDEAHGAAARRAPG